MARPDGRRASFFAATLLLGALSPAVAQSGDPCAPYWKPDAPAGTAAPATTPVKGTRPETAPSPDTTQPVEQKPEIPMGALNWPGALPLSLLADVFAGPAAAQSASPCPQANVPAGGLVAPPIAPGRLATDPSTIAQPPPNAAKTAAAGTGAGAAGSGPSAAVSGVSAVDPSRLLPPTGGSDAGAEVLSAAAGDLTIGDPGSARLRLSRWLAQHPDDAAALILRAEASNRQRDYAAARGDAQRAAQLQPASSRAWEQLAYADHRLGNAAAASHEAELAVGFNPANAMAHYLRYLTSGKAGDLTTAFAALSQAARLNPADYAALERRARAENRFNDPAGESTLGREARLLPRGRGAVAGGLALALFLLLLVAWAPARRDARAVTFSRLAAPKRVAKYELGTVLGRGGMGEVYRGFDADLRRPVAIKRLLEGSDATDKRRQRLLSEARAVAAVHHPAVVEIYDIVQEERDLYIVFELVDGEPLSAVLERRRFSPAETLALLKPVFEALQLAHEKGIVHRDIKPGNLMLEKSGRLKLMDFGIARDATGQATTIAGSPCYMAPEAERGLVTAEGDIYALAICAYQMMAGTLPFPLVSGRGAADYVPLARARPAVPAGLDEALLRALSPDPKARPATVKAFAALLEGCLARA